MFKLEQGVETNNSAAIRRRRVHYFSGFDPRGAAYYQRLSQQEAAKPQPQGGVLSVGRRRKSLGGVPHWPVEWKSSSAVDETQVATDHVFMGWDDIIRAHWSRSPWALAVEFFRTYRGIFFDVSLKRTRGIYQTAFLTGVLPAVYLLGTLLLGIFLGGLGHWLAVGNAPSAHGWVVSAVWVLAAGAVATAWWYGTQKGLFWLLRIFHFIILMGRGPISGLEQRTRDWVEQMVRAQQADPVDEVVLVGHSVGTLVMVYALDGLLNDERWQHMQAGRKTLVLTLGQCYPFVAMVPKAHAFRDLLRRLSFDTRLLWVDVTARIDPLCFYNAHPLAKTGVPHANAPNPVRHTAKFFQMYEPEHWEQIKQDKLLTHFLYLMTPDRPGNFHLMDVLYGPRPFSDQWSLAPHADTSQA